jgi:hypothetical protein
MTATTKSIAKNRTSAKTSVDTNAEISRTALVSLSAAGAIVGLWSFASLIGGMVAVGGPLSLAKAWFGAVVGL